MFVAAQHDPKSLQMGPAGQLSAEERPKRRAGALGEAGSVLDQARGEDGKVDSEKVAEILENLPRARRREVLRQLRRQEGAGCVNAVLATMKGEPGKEEEGAEKEKSEQEEETGKGGEEEERQGGEEGKEGEEEGKEGEEMPGSGGEKEGDVGSAGGDAKKEAPGSSGPEAAPERATGTPIAAQDPEAEAKAEEPKLPEGPQLESVVAPEVPKLTPRPLPGASASVGQRFVQLDSAVDSWAAGAKAEVHTQANEAKSSVRAVEQEAEAVVSAEASAAGKKVRQSAEQARASLEKGLQRRVAALRAEGEQTKASTLARLEVERAAVMVDRDTKVSTLDARFAEELAKMAESTERDAAGAREEAAFYAGECMSLHGSWTIEKLKKLARAKAAQEIGKKVALEIKGTGIERMAGMKQAQAEMGEAIYRDAEQVLEELGRMEEDFVTGVDEQVTAVVELEEQHSLSLCEQLTARGEESASALRRRERAQRRALGRHADQVCTEIDRAAESGRGRVDEMAAEARSGLIAHLDRLDTELAASPELAEGNAAEPAVAALHAEVDCISSELSAAFAQAAAELGKDIQRAAGDSGDGLREAGKETGKACTSSAGDFGKAVDEVLGRERSSLEERCAAASEALSGYETAWVGRAHAVLPP